MNISEMAWGLTLWIDLWAVGIASSSFIAAFIINKMSGGRQEKLFRLSVFSGMVFGITSVILLLSHLGHVEWFWHMFINIRPSSVLSLGGWILTGWLTVAGIMSVLWIAANLFKGLKSFSLKVNGFISWVGLILSFLLITYGGVLIATSNQPLWASTLMLPPLFIASAVATGLAWLVLASFIANWANRAIPGLMKVLFDSSDWQIDSTMTHGLVRALVVALIIETAVLAGFMAWLGAAAPEAFSLLVSGDLAVYFWAGLVGIGIVLPFFLLLYNWSRGVGRTGAVAVAATSSFLTVAGGLILRAVILIGGQL